MTVVNRAPKRACHPPDWSPARVGDPATCPRREPKCLACATQVVLKAPAWPGQRPVQGATAVARHERRAVLAGRAGVETRSRYVGHAGRQLDGVKPRSNAEARRMLTASDDNDNQLAATTFAVLTLPVSWAVRVHGTSSDETATKTAGEGNLSQLSLTVLTAGVITGTAAGPHSIPLAAEHCFASRALIIRSLPGACFCRARHRQYQPSKAVEPTHEERESIARPNIDTPDNGEGVSEQRGGAAGGAVAVRLLLPVLADHEPADEDAGDDVPVAVRVHAGRRPERLHARESRAAVDGAARLRARGGGQAAAHSRACPPLSTSSEEAEGDAGHSDPSSAVQGCGAESTSGAVPRMLSLHSDTDREDENRAMLAANNQRGYHGQADLEHALEGFRSTDENVKDDNRDNALTTAAGYGQIEMVQFFVENCGADVNWRDQEGNTALMKAAETGRLDVVRYLAQERGAQVNIKNKDGNTAMRLAKDHGHNDIVQVLMPFIGVLHETRPRRGYGSTRKRLYRWAVSLRAKMISARVLIRWRKFVLCIGDEADMANSVVSPSAHSLSCTIPPIEVELTLFNLKGDTGGDFQAMWLDADAVVKLFIPDASHSSFDDEVCLWQRLRHPNVIKMYGACDAGSYLKFFVCEYASKGSLLEHVAISSAVTENAMWKYLYEAALGLEYLHERGIFHGNVRCSNILIGNDGIAKLSNFGLSGSKKRSIGGPARVIGSMRWQAPEVLEGGSPSNMSDVYSLGMCILEAATGNKPWGDRDDGWVRFCKEQWTPEMSIDPKFAPKCPQATIRALVWRMCSRNYRKRANLSSVIGELEGLASEESSELQYRPADTFDKYENSRMTEKWLRLPAIVGKSDNIHYCRAFNALKTIYECLQVATHRHTLLARFDALLTEFTQMVTMPPEEAEVMRLSSTRATSNSYYSIQWRIESLMASLGLKDPVDATAPRWQAYEDKSTKVGTKDATDLTPEWFIPWFELIIDDWCCVGEGGFGSVFRAKWLESDVVVKRVTLASSHGTTDSSASTYYSSVSASDEPSATQAEANVTKRAEAVGIFRCEVGIWFRFNHPHVVRLFGACHVGRPFFVCEYAPHGTLVNYLRKNPDELWAKLYEAALGVQYLHARCIVHGDLKGNNIVIGSDLKSKVTDFGLSSVASSGDKVLISSAVHWVAPELLEGNNKVPTFASDVYSFGMCVVEALRVVEAVTSNEGPRVCTPWRVGDRTAVKYHATHGKLPSRPTICEDNQWELITQMCVQQPEKRIKMSTVVDKLAGLASINPASQLNTAMGSPHTADVKWESIPESVAAARQLLTTLQGTITQPDAPISLYVSLWEKLDKVHRRIDVGQSSACCSAFCSLVTAARESTKQLQHTNGSVVSLATSTMRCYALLRSLDKFCDAYFIV
ncbi:hypothetical protein ON010_g8596 [Phytophthora cinnamomi]|nr:hypothetical protein ON010_g8596 [Phytophthora cinnamomi]